MDGSTMGKPDAWARARMAAVWLKDHAPAFTIVTVTFSCLWLALCVCWMTLFTWDMSFYRSLAPPGMELSFQAAGFVFRMFVTAGGLALIWIKQNTLRRATEEAKFLWIKYQRPVSTNYFANAARTLRIIWIMGLIACGVAALGFVTEGNDFHYRKNAAIGQTEAATTDSADSVIARAETEKANIRKDRDGLVQAARTSMNLVLDDGNARNDDVSQYEANIAKYQTEAQAKLDAQDAVIAKAEGDRLGAQREATATAIGDPGLAAVFKYPVRYIQGFDSITFRDAFAIFWVILLELCGSVGAQALLAVQMALSKRKQAQANGAIGGKTTARRGRVKGKLQMIEDLRKEKQQTQVDADGDAEDELELDEEDEGEEPPRQAAE
jgi:hypothetical protein